MESESPQGPASRPTPSYFHLVFAGLFMLVGISVLIYLGSERGPILGLSMVELDLKPLLNTERAPDPSNLKGRVVLLHFWGPWCPPCREEYPEIAKLQSTYAGSSEVEILSVSCAATAPDSYESLRDDTKAMLKALDPDSPVYWDPAEFSRIQVAKLLSQKGFAYPTTVLLDSTGRIQDFWIGATRPGELDRAIRKLIPKPLERS